jgi:hypothetical protein
VVGHGDLKQAENDRSYFERLSCVDNSRTFKLLTFSACFRSPLPPFQVRAILVADAVRRVRCWSRGMFAATSAVSVGELTSWMQSLAVALKMWRQGANVGAGR